MISYFLVVSSIVAIPYCLWLIYDEWKQHHFNARFVMNEVILTNLMIGCFVSLLWPVLVVYIIVIPFRWFLLWYDKKRESLRHDKS